MNGRNFRNAMGKFATGVTVIATEVNGCVHGMTANAFMSISLDPKLIAISLKEEAVMLRKIKESNIFSVNILSEEQQRESMIFAGQIKNEAEVCFEELAEVPVLPNSLAQIPCEVSAEYVEGDHSVFIGRVKDIKLNDGEPLVFSAGRYRKLTEEKLELSSR